MHHKFPKKELLFNPKFLNQLSGLNEGEVIRFGKNVTVDQAFTTVKGILKAFDKLK